jgi:hypothetical protein
LRLTVSPKFPQIGISSRGLPAELWTVTVEQSKGGDKIVLFVKLESEICGLDAGSFQSVTRTMAL